MASNRDRWWTRPQYQGCAKLLDRPPMPCPRCGRRLPMDHERVGITYVACPCGKIYNR